MFSTSRYKGLTHAYLKLNMNSIPAKATAASAWATRLRFIHGTNTAVALSLGGDAICRSESVNSRLDIPAARSFYGQYLALP